MVHPLGLTGKIEVPALLLDDDRLSSIQSQLDRFFTIPPKVRLRWSGHDHVIGKTQFVSLITLVEKGKTVRLNYLLAHEDVPDDILKCAVFEGLLFGYCASAQKKYLADPYANDETAQWCDRSMSLIAASEFWELFLHRFFHWTVTLTPSTTTSTSTSTPISSLPSDSSPL